jgi:hypothetical protein
MDSVVKIADESSGAKLIYGRARKYRDWEFLYGLGNERGMRYGRMPCEPIGVELPVSRIPVAGVTHARSQRRRGFHSTCSSVCTPRQRQRHQAHSLNGALTVREAEAIEQMGIRLERDGRAGLLPADSIAFWFSPDGRCTSLTPGQAWLRLKALQYVVIDRHLLQVIHRGVPVTLLARRTSPAPIPAAVRGRPRKEQAEAMIAA